MQAKQCLQILIWLVKTIEKFFKGEFATGHLRFTDVAGTANDQPFVILMQKSKDNTTFSYRLTGILAVTVAIFYCKSQRTILTNLYSSSPPSC